MNYNRSPFVPVPLRILLVFIAILSAYSIHLLLKSAGVVGKSEHKSLNVFSHRGNSASHAFVIFMCFQGSGLTNSLEIGLSAPQEKCWLPVLLQYTTLEVFSCLFTVYWYINI